MFFKHKFCDILFRKVLICRCLLRGIQFPSWRCHTETLQPGWSHSYRRPGPRQHSDRSISQWWYIGTRHSLHDNPPLQQWPGSQTPLELGCWLSQWPEQLHTFPGNKSVWITLYLHKSLRRKLSSSGSSITSNVKTQRWPGDRVFNGLIHHPPITF